MEKRKWYRVIDPLNPLFGCDVSGELTFGDASMFMVSKLRRIDVTVGDRPYQLIAQEGETLGLWVDVTHLSESPVQDDIITFERGSPYGKFVSEDLHRSPAGHNLMVVRFEEATQFALLDAGNKLWANDTYYGTDAERMAVENKLVGMLQGDVDLLVAALLVGRY